VHSSNSDEQQLAEPYMLQALNRRLGINLKPVHLLLNDGIKVQLDGLDEEHNAVCEIYARVGELKGSQPDKIASDILKMHFYETFKGCSVRKILCFSNEAASRKLTGRSWLAGAAKVLNVEIQIIELTTEIRERVIDAQNRQKMVNDIKF
jgi:hypothetical protein